MAHQPTLIKLGDIAEVIAREFPARDMLTVYVGSNAATPTASLDAITDALKTGWPKLPYLRMVHLLLQGPVSYVEQGLQDRIMAFSIFSAGDVRKAANEGRAFYLPCTLANLDSLIGKDSPTCPTWPFQGAPARGNGEYSLGLSSKRSIRHRSRQVRHRRTGHEHALYARPERRRCLVPGLPGRR